jgi:hypothetical protein
MCDEPSIHDVPRSTPFLGDRVEEMDTRISSLRGVMVVKASVSVTKRLHNIDTSYSDKELVPSKNPIPCFSLTNNYFLWLLIQRGGKC